VFKYSKIHPKYLKIKLDLLYFYKVCIEEILIKIKKHLKYMQIGNFGCIALSRLREIEKMRMSDLDNEF